MKFNELSDMMQKPEPKPDTYEAGMALNQLLKIGTHAIKIHNMIDDDAEMEAWVAKKIDLASNYVKSVHGYTAGEKAGTYDDAGMTEDADYNNFEKNDDYADNVETYGNVDKTPLTPQERQQFANWVKQTADVYAEKAMEGVADIGDDPDMIDGDKNLIPQIKAYLKKSYDANDIQGFANAVSDVEKKFGDEDLLMNDTGYQEASDFSQHAVNYLSGFKLLSSKGKDYTVKTIRGVLDHIDDDPHIASAMLLFQQEFEGTPLQKKVSRKQATESYEPFPEADEMTFEDDDAFYEAFGELGFPEDENELFDAEYRGRKVPLNKPMRGDVKKFKVYVKDPKSGNVKKVNFGHGGSSARKAGQKTMKIRKSNPKARKSFRARHNCANPGPKTKARYWSCRKW